MDTRLDVSKRPDRHKALLDAAEAFGACALICFERGEAANVERGNQLAQDIQPSPLGDIGWQIVDVGILLTKHQSKLHPRTRQHLRALLEAALPAWSDREFGRGNVNHPVIATWLYTAAGAALNRLDYSRVADERLRAFMPIFSQAGDMSEYNSPTYLGPTLVGLANIGSYAALESTRLRAQLIEERLWLSIMTRWHAPTQQLAGPHSRAYADGTLGFGGIIRYLCHAVLAAPVFWDVALAKAYDHDHDAEWAGKIAASSFYFPHYLGAIGEHKPWPYAIHSTTECEDYSIVPNEVYRGGWGQLTTYLTPEYCLGSSERPYVDGGQTESCIAYWQRQAPVKGIGDYRALYFRYVANQRLPGQENLYHQWYGGGDRRYSANLLHQDGRLHVFQHANKAIILAQPLRRENGRLTALRFDALLPVYVPLDEIWLGRQKVNHLPVTAGVDQPITIRDREIFLALRPLQPTRLDAIPSELEISLQNNHLIISVYNLRGDQPQAFAAQALDNTHNGYVLEIGSASEFGSFAAFQAHILRAECFEQVWLDEFRRIHYLSGQDDLQVDYHPGSQTFSSHLANGGKVTADHFQCPDAVQSSGGRLAVRDVSLVGTPGVPAWLAYVGNRVTAVLPTDQPSSLRLASKFWVLSVPAFAAGRIEIETGPTLDIHIDAMTPPMPFRLAASKPLGRVSINGVTKEPKVLHPEQLWELS